MSNIEEDINILINLKKYLNLLMYKEGKHKIFYNDLGWDEKTVDCINAITHILSEREADKKKIKELEEENHIQRSQIMTVYDNGWIPKQKVKDLKESIILGPTIVGGRRNSKTLEYGIKLGKIKACEELLEEK